MGNIGSSQSVAPVNYIVARLSGLVAYSDGSREQFAVHLDHRGNLSYNDLSESIESIQQVHHANNWLDAMFAIVSSRDADPHIAFTPAAPATPKTVVSLVAELSGRVSITPTQPFQKTWEDFIFQFDSNKSDPPGWDSTSMLGPMIPSGDTGLEGDGGTTAWNKAATDFTIQLNSMFVGMGIQVD